MPPCLRSASCGHVADVSVFLVGMIWPTSGLNEIQASSSYLKINPISVNLIELDRILDCCSVSYIVRMCPPFYLTRVPWEPLSKMDDSCYSDLQKLPFLPDDITSIKTLIHFNFFFNHVRFLKLCSGSNWLDYTGLSESCDPCSTSITAEDDHSNTKVWSAP